MYFHKTVFIINNNLVIIININSEDSHLYKIILTNDISKKTFDI